MCKTMKNHRRSTTSSKPLALFLDIDGILHSTDAAKMFETPRIRENERRRVAIVRGESCPGSEVLLQTEPQELLANVLAKHAHVVIVISSAWRNWESVPYWENIRNQEEAEDSSSLDWLKSLLHPEIAERIIAKTPVFTSGAASKTFLGFTRLDEIRSFMATSADRYGLSSSWVAIDDQARHFPSFEIRPFYDENISPTYASASGGEVVVLINGELSLNVMSAAALDAAIEHASVCTESAFYPGVDIAA
jgi:hypothetical protein